MSIQGEMLLRNNLFNSLAPRGLRPRGRGLCLLRLHISREADGVEGLHESHERERGFIVRKLLAEADSGIQGLISVVPISVSTTALYLGSPLKGANTHGLGTRYLCSLSSIKRSGSKSSAKGAIPFSVLLMGMV